MSIESPNQSFEAIDRDYYAALLARGDINPELPLGPQLGFLSLQFFELKGGLMHGAMHEITDDEWDQLIHGSNRADS